MSKTELIAKVAEQVKMPKSQVATVVNGTFDVITDALKAGDKVTVTGFGAFEAVERKARVARNPQTGAEVKVAAHKAPHFKAGKLLKDAVM